MLDARQVMRTRAELDRPNLDRLRTFVGALAALIDERLDEARVLAGATPLLAALVAHDDWLPAAYAAPDPARYQQYLLHCDARERFSVVSFVWGPGQATPVHDHRVWGMIGVLRGAELDQRYVRTPDGRLIEEGARARLAPGQVGVVSPTLGDLHRVQNAYADRVSISIHVYGANIGAVERATYDARGAPKRFISGYANDTLPNLWDRSKST